jgi:predicted homoserine dehydrogenase-like protein
MLDGEGGFMVWGKLLPAAKSLQMAALPIGLAGGIKLTRPVKQGEIVRWSDVAIDDSAPEVKLRRELETRFAPV